MLDRKALRVLEHWLPRYVTIEECIGPNGEIILSRADRHIRKLTFRPQRPVSLEEAVGQVLAPQIMALYGP